MIWLYDHKDLVSKLGIVFLSASVSWIEEMHLILKLCSTLVAIVVGVMTCIKLYKDLKK